MPKFKFQSNNSNKSAVEVEAETESNARYLAMIELYGTGADDICPSGPQSGVGLILVRH